jgi:hypothetical protein
MKHTPGKWEVRTTMQQRPKIIGGNRILAEVIVYEFPETKANARLIASAPELLEACKILYAEIADKRLSDILKKAIAKAEGAI